MELVILHRCSNTLVRVFTYAIVSAVLLAACEAVAAPLHTGSVFAITGSFDDGFAITEFDADSGAAINSFGLPAPPQAGGGSGLAYSNGTLYYSTVTGATVYKLNSVTGEQTGSFSRTFTSARTTLVGLDALGIGTSSHGATLFGLHFPSDQLFLLNPDTGAVFDSMVLSFNAIGGLDYNPMNQRLYVSAGDGMVHVLDPDSGSIESSFNAGSQVYGLGFVGGRLFTSTLSQVVERNPLTGAVIRAVNSVPSAGLAGGPIPEPSAVSLLALGSIGLVASRLWLSARR